MRSARPSRRRFLSSVVWLGGLAHRPRVRAHPGGRTDEPLARQLRGVLPHFDSAVVVGRAYLETAPELPGAQALAGIVAAECGGRLFEAGREPLRARLARRIRRDFADGRIVRVDGWVLALTEARLCAMAAQLSRGTIRGR